MKNSTTSQQMNGQKTIQFAPMIQSFWGELFLTRVSIAKLYCSTCQRVTDLKVGKYKDEMEKGSQCPRCKGRGTEWMNSYPRNNPEGCVCIVDEEQV